MDIKVTETAKSKLYDMGVSEDIFLRIGVSSGGCSGNTYDAVLDDKMNAVDEVMEMLCCTLMINFVHLNFLIVFG